MPATNKGNKSAIKKRVPKQTGAQTNKQHTGKHTVVQAHGQMWEDQVVGVLVSPQNMYQMHAFFEEGGGFSAHVIWMSDKSWIGQVVLT